MNGRADLGREVIASLRACLGIDAAMSPESPHRFRWSPGGREQTAWVSPALEHDAAAGSRVDLRTDVSLRLDGCPAAVEALRSRLPLATLCGVVRHSDDPARLQLASSLRVRADNRGRAVRLLSAAARLQLREAFVIDRLAATASSEDRRPEPDHGHGHPRLPVPGSTWSDVEDCAAALRHVPGARVVRMPGGVTASLPFGEGGERCLLELLAVAERPALGQGIEVILTVPGEGGLVEALELNEWEIATRSDTDLLGSWSTRPGGRVFTTFLPVAAWSRGLPLETVLGYVRRMRGVASLPTRCRS